MRLVLKKSNGETDLDRNPQSLFFAGLRVSNEPTFRELAD